MGNCRLTRHALNPLVIEKLFRRVASSRVLIQAVRDEVFDDIRLLVFVQLRQVRLLCLDRFGDSLFCLAYEGVLGAKHDVSEDAKSPRVNLAIVRSTSLEYFGGHINVCAEL